MSPISIQPEHRSIAAPEDLRTIQGWLIWRYETFPYEVTPRKVPYYVSGGRRRGHQGSAVDKASLTTFAAARDAAAKRGFNGVGFAPLEEFGITALDFDKCVDANGHMPEVVKQIVSRTYAEYSPSGKGVRAFLRGNLGNHKSRATSDQFGFETFSTSGFVTFTGHALPTVELLGLENTMAPVDASVQDLCRQRFGDERPAAGAAGDDPFAGLEKPLGLTIERMEGLLADIDPDLGRDDWIRVGMALHFECQGDDTGFSLWNDWSAKGGKYPSEEALKAQWESFDRPRPAGRRPVTMATVMRLAKQANPGQAASQAATAEELQAAMADTPAGNPKDAFATKTEFGGKYKILSANTLSQRPPGDWLVKGVIPLADILVMFGPSGSGKSFVALDVAASIARGIPWRERKAKKGRVLIIAAEGGTSFGKRLKAYAQHHNISPADLDIGIIIAAPNFMQKDEIIEIVSAIRNAGGADLIIADTFAQVTSGANENAGEDMGLALANAKALREATGAPVMLIHHAGKDVSRGARGWSGIKAAVDAEIEIIKHESGGREIFISKMKDGEDGLQFGFKLEIVKLGTDADGDDITSCVAVEAEVPVAPPPEETTRKGVKAYSVDETHVLKVAEEMDISVTVMPLEEFITVCVDKLPPLEEGKRDARRARMMMALQSLTKRPETPVNLRSGIVWLYE